MERKLYLELCQRQATKGGVLVEYDGIAYQPYAYELKFQPDGKIKHPYRTLLFFYICSSAIFICSFPKVSWV